MNVCARETTNATVTASRLLRVLASVDHTCNEAKVACAGDISGTSSASGLVSASGFASGVFCACAVNTPDSQCANTASGSDHRFDIRARACAGRPSDSNVVLLLVWLRIARFPVAFSDMTRSSVPMEVPVPSALWRRSFNM